MRSGEVAKANMNTVCSIPRSGEYAGPTIILNASALQRALIRIAHEIAERNEASAQVVLVGVQRGGVYLAQRLAGFLSGIWGHPVQVGSVDIGMHRDDLDQQVAPRMHRP